MIGFCLLLAGCAVDEAMQQRGNSAIEAVAAEWPALEQRSDHSIIELNQTESFLRIVVLPDGRLARFGHPHVIGGAISGRLSMDSTRTVDWLDARVAVSTLEVDRPEWRAAEGFEAELEAEAIAGTRKNMLGPKVLDAVQFPMIELRAIPVGGNAVFPEIDLYVRLRGETRRLPMTAAIEFPVRQSGDTTSAESQLEGRMVASGSVVIRQSDFDIEPFSALAGGLSVADALTVRYRLVIDLPAE
ncbi:MAG: hypothetical protein AAF446_01615 [Pseudomonadota bacterium]